METYSSLKSIATVTICIYDLIKIIIDSINNNM